MSHTDLLGNRLSVAGAETAHGIDDFVDGFLSYETKAGNILRAADSDPDSPLANTYAAMLFLFLEAPDAAAHAAPYFERAQKASARADKRETLNLEFAHAWGDGAIDRALQIGAALNADYPRDLVILKLRQYLLFNRGDAAGMLRAAEEVFDANRDVAQMHGMIAFAYEQCHLLEEAEDAARTAIALKQKEPWAQHALAHVMITQGRIDEGARFMESVAPLWTGLNSFMLTHNWWHLALFYLSQGRFKAALDIYDSYVWGADKTYTQDQIGAVSLLTRMEIAGIDVGDRWTDVANHLVARSQDTVLPFLTMQYVYGLARAGRPEADRLLEATRAAAGAGDAAWSAVALPACEGLVNYARKNFALAVEQLGAALPRLAAIGGSHAQRDLFEQIWLDALIRKGDLSAAQQALELRRRADPDGVPVNRALADVYNRLGLKPQAEKAAARASRTLSAHQI